MLGRIFTYLLSDSWLGRQLDGKKTVIGGVAVVLSAVLHGLEEVAPAFPHVAWIPAAAHVIDQVSTFLDDVGLSFLTVGLAHKEIKKKKRKS